MKRLIAAALLAGAALVAHAQVAYPYFMREIQMDSIGNSMVPKLNPFPDPGVRCFRILDGDRKTTGPSCYRMGSSFTVDTDNVVNVPAPTWAAISGKPTSFAPAPHTHTWGDILSRPTSLAGYGITDAVLGTDSRLTDSRAPLAHTHAIADVVGLQVALDGKLSGITGAQVTAALGLTPVSQAGARTAITLAAPAGGGAASYNSGTGLLTIPTPAAAAARVKTSVTKPVGTCFQLSPTRDAWVTYNVEIASASNLVGGQRGTLYLETFTDSACTAGTEEVMRSTSGNTMGLGVSLGNTVYQTLNVNGWVFAGLYAKLRTVNDVSTPTFTPRPGQEVLQ